MQKQSKMLSMNLRKNWIRQLQKLPLKHSQDILCTHLLHCTLCILVQCNPIPANNISSKLKSIIMLNTHDLSKKLLLASCARDENKMEETVALIVCKCNE